MSPVAVARQTVSAIGTVLHVERSPAGRRLAQMGSFVLDQRDRLAIRPTSDAAIGIAAAEVTTSAVVPTEITTSAVAA
jgi:hypothetical protein